MTTKQRIEWIDCLKGVGIILVVFAHLNPDLPIKKYIFSFHMFLFFFISGYLFHPSSYKVLSYVKKKAISLLIPYCVYGIFSALYEIIQGGDISQNILAFFMINGKISWNTPIWFLWILFAVEIIYFNCFRLLPQKIINTVFPAACLLFSILLKEQTLLPFRIGIIPIGLFFFWAGHFIQNSSIYDYIDQHRFILLISIILSIVLSNINGRISVVNTKYHNFWICVPCGIIGVISFSALVRYVFTKTKIPFLTQIGKNTCFIMCIQYPIFRLLASFSKIVLNMDAWKDEGTIKALIVSVISLAIIYLLLLLLNRFIPNRIKKFIGIFPISSN